VSITCFRSIIEEGESFYLEQEKTKMIDFEEKLDVLDALYAYKEKWHDCIDVDTQTLFLPLTKEVIRRLENHLEDKYNWKQPGYCARTLKPLFVTGSLFMLTSCLVKFLDVYNMISPDVFWMTTIATSTSIPIVLVLWLLYNYQQELYRLGRAKKEII
jgi:hypothetical protein